MPTLRRTIARVVNVLFAELRRVAKQEGPEGEYLLSVSDITADYIKRRQAIKAELLFMNKVVWKQEIPISELDVMTMEYGRLKEKITAVMRANLSLVAQLHFARLEQLFPKAIKDVHINYDPDKHTKVVVVEFKNGYVAEAPEAEAKTDLFTARCAMLYDLPPL